MKWYQKIRKDIKNNRFVLLFLLFYFAFSEYFFHGTCPVRLFLHIPCPGCGLTRAFFALITFHFREAASLNSSIYLWVPFLIFLFITRYFHPVNKKITTFLLIVVCLFTLFRYCFYLQL